MSTRRCTGRCRRADYRCRSFLSRHLCGRPAGRAGGLFIEPARRRPEQRFLIGGAQYPQDFPWTPNIFFVRHLPPPEHPAFFSSSRLTLNVTRAGHGRDGLVPSGRLFEAAACGAPILTDDWEGLDAFFEPGREILVATSGRRRHRGARSRHDELREIARRARERTLASTPPTAAPRAGEGARRARAGAEPAGRPMEA